MTSETKMILDELRSFKGEMKKDLNEVKVELSEMKRGVNEVKIELNEVKGDLNEVKVELSEVKNDVDRIKITLENEIRRNITIIAEGHLDLNRKLDNALKVEHEKELLLVRMNMLETNVRELRELKES